MAKKKKCPECPAGEKWAVPYADFLSLLLALFIALYAISAANTEKVKALKTEFIKIFDYAPKPEQAQPIITIPPNPGENPEVTSGQKQIETDKLAQETITEAIQQGGILEQVEDGIVLKLPTSIMFKPNQSTIQDQDSLLFIKRIVQIIKKLPSDVRIDVRGFANNPDIATTHFKNNYELASARALDVMNHLIKEGVSPNNIFFSSQGQYGKPFQGSEEKKLAHDNRVEIYFFVKENQDQKVQDMIKDIIYPKN
ncbi:flagellar motor protein MotB [Helicobacter cholecystus]|uniref:Flagellar motor protein MotB n=1 Tax=Helicobacter cholecystus TaxID=45498 RepID=A0A3D8ITS2_9HELI|nr:flagellar motor protein MotB [Helicobacter cholecystus]RDU68689.1 flagellar motor protein MotB [Helicobacter cholecystus]VEJ26131.1 Flagellar motor rotation protein [Helicobacter cholecystus]